MKGARGDMIVMWARQADDNRLRMVNPRKGRSSNRSTATNATLKSPITGRRRYHPSNPLIITGTDRGTVPRFSLCETVFASTT